jgi:hypothetical protein
MFQYRDYRQYTSIIDNQQETKTEAGQDAISRDGKTVKSRESEPMCILD